MVESFLYEKELDEFKSRMQATVKKASEHGVSLTPFEHTQYNPLDVILAFYTERLERSSKRLNCLTCVLTGLTAILAILTVVSLCGMF